MQDFNQTVSINIGQDSVTDFGQSSVSIPFGYASFRFTCSPSQDDIKWLKKDVEFNGQIVIKFIVLQMVSDQSKKSIFSFLERKDFAYSPFVSMVAYSGLINRDLFKMKTISQLDLNGEVQL